MAQAKTGRSVQNGAQVHHRSPIVTTHTCEERGPGTATAASPSQQAHRGRGLHLGNYWNKKAVAPNVEAEAESEPCLVTL